MRRGVRLFGRHLAATWGSGGANDIRPDRPGYERALAEVHRTPVRMMVRGFMRSAVSCTDLRQERVQFRAAESSAVQTNPGE